MRCKRSNPSKLPGTHLAMSDQALCSLIVSWVEGGSTSRLQSLSVSCNDEVRSSQFPCLWNGVDDDNRSCPIYPQAATKIKYNTTVGTVKWQSNKSKGIIITIFSPTGLVSYLLCIKKTSSYISLCLLHILFVPLYLYPRYYHIIMSKAEQRLCGSCQFSKIFVCLQKGSPKVFFSQRS